MSVWWCAVPPILVASIAMQESTCNANTVGGAGEQGLMQLTQDKCGSAPNGNCRDVVSWSAHLARENAEFRLCAGLQYQDRNEILQHSVEKQQWEHTPDARKLQRLAGGHDIRTFTSGNTSHMCLICKYLRVRPLHQPKGPAVDVRTTSTSMSPLKGPFYSTLADGKWHHSLHQTLNGWVQNINPYTSNPRIGKYFNLDQCFSDS